MSRSGEPWLPFSVATRPAVRDTIEETVAEWSAHWFADFRVRVAPLESVAPGSPGQIGEAGQLLRGECIALSSGDRAKLRLVHRALDLDPTAASPTEADRAIMHAVGSDLLQDLIARLERALGGKRTDRKPEGGARASLTDAAGDVLIRLDFPFASLQAICAASLPAPRRPVAFTSGRLQAAIPQRVTLDAVLGTAELSLEDIRSLAPGDVLVLDRRLEEPAAIMLRNSDVTIARATIAETGAHRAMVLSAEESGELQ